METMEFVDKIAEIIISMGPLNVGKIRCEDICTLEFVKDKKLILVLSKGFDLKGLFLLKPDQCREVAKWLIDFADKCDAATN